MTLPATTPKAESPPSTAPYGSHGGSEDVCENCGSPFERRVHNGPNRQRFCSSACRSEWHDRNPIEKDEPFSLSMMNPNPSFRTRKDGDHYLVEFELTREEWQWFTDPNIDRTGMVIEAQAMVTHRAQRQEPKPKGGVLSQEAARKCRELAFCEYSDSATEDEAREFILEKCQIKSRAELDHDPAAAERFKVLMREFAAWVSER